MNKHFAQRMNTLFIFLFISLFVMCRKNVSEPPTPPPPPIETPDLPPPQASNYSLVPFSHKVNNAFNGFYMATPPTYSDISKKFPLLVFLHGLGQMGNGSTELHYITYDGIGKLIKENRLPNTFEVNGEKHSFVVISPQSSRQPTADEVKQLVDYATSTYRIDTTRIYLSGLSMGARVVTLTAAKYPLVFAAIVPIAGVADHSGMQDRCKIIAESNLPVWELHNADDPMADVNSARRFIDYISSFQPAIAPRLTIFDAYGHDAWTTALSPTYKEDNLNIYEWMLQFKR